ncbi:MAG: hypothetical protein MZV70_34740 [Desulfobacterales bacterium]|nr:hypothetical protein [Desulfobacterales bacterium]
MSQAPLSSPLRRHGPILEDIVSRLRLKKHHTGSPLCHRQRRRTGVEPRGPVQDMHVPGRNGLP